MSLRKPGVILDIDKWCVPQITGGQHSTVNHYKLKIYSLYNLI